MLTSESPSETLVIRGGDGIARVNVDATMRLSYIVLCTSNGEDPYILYMYLV